MAIQCKRIYEDASKNDGYRVLADAIWPRGVSKDEAEVDEWLKEVAPSDSLRDKFHDDELSWDEFRKKYMGELKSHRERLKKLLDEADGRITLLYASKDEKHNNAVVLEQYLEMLD